MLLEFKREFIQKFKMRVFVAACILGIFILVSSDATNQSHDDRYHMYMSIMENCLKEHGMSKETYATANSTYNVNGIYEKAKCVDLCMLQVLKVMRPDGSVDHDLAMEHLLSGKPGIQRDNMKRNLEACLKKRSENPCDTAHDVVICALGYPYNSY